MAGLLGIGGLCVVYGVTQLAEEGYDSVTVVTTFSVAAGLCLAGGLVLPSAWFAYRRLRFPDREPIALRKNMPAWLPFVLVLFLIPPALVTGYWVIQYSSLEWLLLPVISLLVTGLPIWWLVTIGKRGLSAGSLQRQWGLFAGGLVLSPVIIIIFEMVALVGLILVASFVIALDPDLVQAVAKLTSQLENPLSNADNWQEILTPTIQHPVFLAGVYAYAAVLIPLIEEALKPLGLWLLAGRRLTPAEGFVGGVICGAAFALFENLSALTSGGEEWAVIAGMRISTALLHMLNTGVMGWALANAWTKGRYLWLALSYACTVSLHGIWNFLGIAGFSLPQYNPGSVDPSAAGILPGLIVIGLGLLTGVNFLIFLGINRRLRPKNEWQYGMFDKQIETPPSLD